MSVAWRAYVRVYARLRTHVVHILVSIKHEALAIDFTAKSLLLAYLRSLSSLELALLLLLHLVILLRSNKCSTSLQIVSWL